MRETIMVATKTRAAVFGFGIGVSFFAFLIGATESLAGILDATWTAPRTNADGSALTDLASYRVYYGTQSAPCPGTTRAQVASPTSSPSANQTVTSRLTGLTAGTRYSVAVTAVDVAGNESVCSGVASAVARAEFSVSPSGTVNFGTVSLGSVAEQTITVSNTGGTALSGTASIAAPFSIVSGSPFTLSGLGTTQAVRVRFTPTTTTTVSTNITERYGEADRRTHVARRRHDRVGHDHRRGQRHRQRGGGRRSVQARRREPRGRADCAALLGDLEHDDGLGWSSRADGGRPRRGRQRVHVHRRHRDGGERDSGRYERSRDLGGEPRDHLHHGHHRLHDERAERYAAGIRPDVSVWDPDAPERNPDDVAPARHHRTRAGHVVPRPGEDARCRRQPHPLARFPVQHALNRTVSSPSMPRYQPGDGGSRGWARTQPRSARQTL